MTKRKQLVETSDVQADLKHVLYTKEQIQQRVAELAAEIDKDYEGREVLLVGVLKGAVMIMADLARALRSHLKMDWMAVSSYGSGTQSSGVVRILKDLDTDIAGRDVLLVEDIVDTGLTLSYLLTNLEARGPESVHVCTLLDKSVRRIAPVEPRYAGFDCPDRFVLGYGLDFRQRYRNLADILAIDDMAALQADPDALVPLLADGVTPDRS